MTELSTQATHQHPNMERTQASWDAVRVGDYGSVFETLADDIILINGPGAGPWHVARGLEDMGLLLMEFTGALGGTFQQDGRCVYADDRVAISLVHETGRMPDGDVFDNLAIYVNRLLPDGRTDRIWTVDLDTEHCEEFWQRNQGKPSKDFN